ncbi:hypothetical protein [Pseudomonas parafulva]|uniref:hypothetical protein n=1 Tax=Pseudomonas parafulva TaxID=157782 RepID=UPI0013C32F44|nr:hypothetical protein [Pseudomonas parafulva]
MSQFFCPTIELAYCAGVALDKEDERIERLYLGLAIAAPDAPFLLVVDHLPVPA